MSTQVSALPDGQLDERRRTPFVADMPLAHSPEICTERAIGLGRIDARRTLRGHETIDPHRSRRRHAPGRLRRFLVQQGGRLWLRRGPFPAPTRHPPDPPDHGRRSPPLPPPCPRARAVFFGGRQRGGPPPPP